LVGGGHRARLTHYNATDLGVSAAAVRKAKSRVLYRLRQELGELIG
jgi:hypothetical protein